MLECDVYLNFLHKMTVLEKPYMNHTLSTCQNNDSSVVVIQKKCFNRVTEVR